MFLINISFSSVVIDRKSPYMSDSYWMHASDAILFVVIIHSLEEFSTGELETTIKTSVFRFYTSVYVYIWSDAFI